MGIQKLLLGKDNILIILKWEGGTIMFLANMKIRIKGQSVRVIMEEVGKQIKVHVFGKVIEIPKGLSFRESLDMIKQKI